MKPSENFARQHGELLVMANEISAVFASPGWEKDPAPVARLVAKFTGKLAVHNAMESEALYPRLLAHSDERVRTKARELLDEIDGIYDAFGTFAKRWASIDEIRARPMDYASGVKKLFAILGKRMGRENHELYPLADAHLG